MKTASQMRNHKQTFDNAKILEVAGAIIIALTVVVAIVGGFMVHWALGAIILAIFMLLFSILARA